VLYSLVGILYVGFKYRAAIATNRMLSLLALKGSMLLQLILLRYVSIYGEKAENIYVYYYY